MNYLQVISQKNKNHYINEVERNVHVWCSLPELETSRYRAQKYDAIGANNARVLGLVAGFYNKDRVTVAVFYKWLDLIIDRPATAGSTAILVGGPDPRTLKFDPPLGNVPVAPDNRLSERILSLDGPILGRDDESLMLPGHYFIHKRAKRGDLKPWWPTLVEPLKSPRKSAGYSTESRSKAAVTLARKRDRKCVVSGRIIINGERGPDWTAVEIAHIIYVAASQDDTWKKHLPERMAAAIQNWDGVDVPENMMGMRVDIHRFYDAFQWSGWPSKQERVWNIVTFEESKAYVMEPYTSFEVSEEKKITVVNMSETDGRKHRVERDVTVPQVNPLFLEIHMYACLVINVRGAGDISTLRD